jgi:23S rRNA (adenine2503-C2)-methyltransferase
MPGRFRATRPALQCGARLWQFREGMTTGQQHVLLGLDIQELTELVENSGEPAYRGRQLFQAIYGQRLESPDEISTLPQSFRRSLLEQGYAMGQPAIEKRFVSSDGTVRYLMLFGDGESVEAVWMPEGDSGEAGDGSEAGDEEEKGRDWQRATICVSSQVGCAVGCEFCLTALLGVKRNLEAGEIVGQIISVLNDQKAFPGRERLNLVFMGMGEPLLNFDNFMKAVRLLVEGVGIPESRMTVSTVGIVPRIHDLGKEAVRPKLAISLNASNNELRSRLMPLNRKWNLEALLEAARHFPLKSRERLTFEYVLLDRVNDSLDNARQVLELIRGIRAKVNLIALNPGPGIEFATPAQERVLAFQQVLIRGGVPTFIRRPRGRDIYAACGQLKRTSS